MLFQPELLQNKEAGKTCVILGNGPSANQLKNMEFTCDIIGINKSITHWPKQAYYTTVSYDRLADVAAGKVKADVAIFSCRHKMHSVPEPNPHPMVWINMPKEDLYAAKSGVEVIFDPDLTKGTYKSFSGLFAMQVALYLGYTTLYLVGFDGGTDNFTGVTRGDPIPGTYHNKCLWHVAEWAKSRPDINIYNTNRYSQITWWEYKFPPISTNTTHMLDWEVVER